MPRQQVVIIGAGLSGLYASHLLTQRGVSHVLLEARDRTGGRVQSDNAGFDLGATWFWPSAQTRMAALIKASGLATFEQFETGQTLLEHAAHLTPVRQAAFESAGSTRLVGGMSALVNHLTSTLAANTLQLNCRVHSLRSEPECVQVEATDAEGYLQVFEAGHVLLCAPPRVALRDVVFSPELQLALAARWRSTATWMAPHAKFVAVYDTPFWRENGLSGMARSAVGPMVEIHDASQPGGPYALFGFIGMAAAARKQLGDAALRQRCLDQLVRLFGRFANHDLQHATLKDWAQDELTATALDQTAAAHSLPQGPLPTDPVWSTRLLLAGSEASHTWPGYLAGALQAAEAAVRQLRV